MGKVGEKPTSNESTTKSDKPMKKSVSRSAKSGLVWPVSRTHRKIVNTGGVKRVSAGAPVFVSAVIEFFAAELLELAGDVCKDPDQPGGARKRLMPRDVLQALRSDKELSKATAGLRVLVGDKVQRAETTAAITTAAVLVARKTAAAAKANPSSVLPKKVIAAKA